MSEHRPHLQSFEACLGLCEGTFPVSGRIKKILLHWGQVHSLSGFTCGSSSHESPQAPGRHSLAASSWLCRQEGSHWKPVLGGMKVLPSGSSPRTGKAKARSRQRGAQNPTKPRAANTAQHTPGDAEGCGPGILTQTKQLTFRKATWGTLSEGQSIIFHLHVPPWVSSFSFPSISCGRLCGSCHHGEGGSMGRLRWTTDTCSF